MIRTGKDKNPRNNLKKAWPDEPVTIKELMAINELMAERDDIPALAHKYIFGYIGLNVEPKNITEAGDQYLVELEARVPHEFGLGTEINIIHVESCGILKIDKESKKVVFATPNKEIDAILNAEVKKQLKPIIKDIIEKCNKKLEELGD